MKKNFGILENKIRIKESAGGLWMGPQHGEGELGIRNQGRFEQSRFSQETVAIDQHTPRIGESRSKLRFTQEVSSAGRTLASDSTPPFFSPESKDGFYTTDNEKAALRLARRTQTRLQALIRDAKSSAEWARKLLK